MTETADADGSHGSGHRERGVSRRAFAKSAVAIGGTAALAACLDRGGPDLPQGTDDPASLPTRQHAWNASLATDAHGNDVAPRHHVVLLLAYAGSGTPTDDERTAVESALRTLERAYPWGHDGLLFTVGWSPAYFDRFGSDRSESVDLPAPTALAPFEDPALDTPDAVVHLASDHPSVVLGAEAALFGDTESLNGLAVEATVDGVLERSDRRTGFVGAGLPAENQDVEGIPESDPVDEESPLYMGFKSGFRKNQASEDRVTIARGPFAGGTTQHLSLIRLHLDQWYEQDSRFHREAAMFCPVHAAEGRIDGVGENLGDSSGMAETGCPAHATDHAAEHGIVGHSQKTARAREKDAPLILRRDFDSTDGGHASLHFLALQERIADFVSTREAMNGSDVASETPVGQRTNNGILQYLTVERRGNYLLPPRSHRALPQPNPG